MNMEEGERKSPAMKSTPQDKSPPTSALTANGRPAGNVGKEAAPVERSGAGVERLAGIAKMFSAKAKEKGGPGQAGKDGKPQKENGCVDDLPLGSEAHHLSFEHTNGIDSKHVTPAEKRSKWSFAQSVMGWQSRSFNSDVSNQTSASSASLDMLLNQRELDPEEMLLNLGFGGQTQSYVPSLARVPERFLHHPSRAYGIAAPGGSEEAEEGTEDSTAPAPATSGGTTGTSTATTGAPPAKKRTGIWTLARTISLLRARTNPAVTHVSPSHTPSGTPPLDKQHISILHPTNQMYLARQGYYEKQGWPRGTFLEAEEDAELAAKEEKEKDAASRRKMYQKTRTKRNWSMCDSAENEDLPAGASEWISKSMDDSLSRDDLTENDTSLGRGHYFSCTTESSTDSLDTPNPETERAFEEIRRQYNEGRRKERSSSEDLFLPRRKKRLSSEIVDNEEESKEESDHETSLDLLDTSGGASTNYFVSPASSRQATVEKAPTICDNYLSINLNDDAGDEPEDKSNKNNDDNNNKSKNRQGDLAKLTTYTTDSVRIIVSNSDLTTSDSSQHLTRVGLQAKSLSKLTVQSAQRASSDSGSSSSGTAIGSNSVATATDDADTLRLSESENSITDRDSISRTHSPCAFSPRVDKYKLTVSSYCQTTESDFQMAAAAAANQNVNATTATARNKFQFQIKVGKTGVHSPKAIRKSGEYAHLDESPRVQLSALPTTINPLELMKRLQHSQDELSRMGSIQSDSSGFGDTDPATDSLPQDMDVLKVASLGSSSESSGTLASSTATAILREPRRGEMATQTSVDSSKDKGTESHNTIDKEQAKQSPRPRGETPRYVTMCYIPSLTSKPGQSEGLRYRGGGAGGRPRVDSDPALDMSHWGTNRYPEWSFRPRGNSDAYRDYRGYEPEFDPRRRRYDSGPDVPDGYFRGHPDVHDPVRNYDPHRAYDQPLYVSDVHLRSGVPYLEREITRGQKSPRRTYTSQIDLYTNEKGLHQREVTYHSHPATSPFRRHSDEGILEGRNDTPLSLELAQAMGSRGRGPTALSTSSTASATTFTSTTTTTAQTTMTGNVVASTSVYIHPATTATTTTSARYKTEAGFHFPPLAGNLSGLRTNLHSTPSEPARPHRPVSSRQRSCDILEDDFGDGDPIPAAASHLEGQHVHTHPTSFTKYSTFPKQRIATGSYSPWHEPSPLAQLDRASPPYAYSLPPYSHSRTSDDLETFSSVAESSSDFSIHSSPEGHPKTGILDSRKLARLINQPIYFKGSRRGGSHYRPRRLFKEWSLLSKRKRLQEENRLLQYALQKYKTELSILETSFMVEYQAAQSDLTDEERAEVEELEWLYGEVRGQVMEMEHLLTARVKSVHAGNDFHSLMSSMGAINKTIELIKEQIYQQQVANNRAEDGRDDDYDDDLDFFEDDFGFHGRRRGSFHSAHSWMGGAGHMSSPQPMRRTHSSSTSHLPSELNESLEQIKLSLLSQVQSEIKESTRRLEQDLQEKDREIKQLQEQLGARSTESVGKSPRRWTPKQPRPRSSSSGQGQPPLVQRSNSRSRLVGDVVVQETDV